MKIPVYNSIEDYLDDEVAYEKETVSEVGDESNLFWLKMYDDSMSPEIGEDEEVLFMQTKKIDGSGKTVLVSVGKKYSVRRIEYSKDSLWLRPVNEAYETEYYNCSDLVRVKLVAVKL